MGRTTEHRLARLEALERRVLPGGVLVHPPGSAPAGAPPGVLVLLPDNGRGDRKATPNTPPS